ncbi:uncharacterized protein C8R40DRAFT_1073555 [Lentinula edodes]|uniref:uncharacterized protein n=1 Tax=Lentinula edodes TaxID=5353 RepID=UPI001E8D9D46|nr:uncharacterized protein C8R40DRAFT_1073555 [Lentinula edodes]KAH7870100.1 hypothetical protein C8R40DRAFT_1073555 [Lentinula edodes]
MSNKTDPALNIILQKIRLVNFAEHADALRPGHKPIIVSIPEDSSKFERGGMNVHIPLTFSDGVRWLARIRQKSTPSTRLILESEIQTMQFLNAAGMQVPNAFMPRGSLTIEQQHDLIDSLARFYINLSHISFTQSGSLVRDPASGNLEVGPLISLDFCQDQEDRLPGPFFFGPFQSSAHRYLAQIEHVLREIEQGSRAFAGDEDVISVYVAHLWLKDLMQNSPRLWEEGEQTFLKHADDKGDQIMVDKDGKFVGVIDWEWAYTASKSEAFAAPLALVDVNPFFDGINDLSSNEEHLVNAYNKYGFPDLAKCVRDGKVYQRLPMVIGQQSDLVQLRALEHALTGKMLDCAVNIETVGEWVEDMAGGCYRMQVLAMKKIKKVLAAKD